MITPDSFLLTIPTGTPAQCSASILSQPHGEYDAMSVQQIVDGYFKTCTDAEMDPVMLVAQMIHETGNLTSWWSQRPRRNPAGIGVTGRTFFGEAKPLYSAWAKHDHYWAEGCSFGSWAGDAIPAHVGRLLAYALRAGYGTPKQQHLIEYAMNVRALPVAYRGAAPTWRGLNGRWAVPGTIYAQSIIRLQEQITK